MAGLQKFDRYGPDTAIAIGTDAYTANDVVGGLITVTLDSLSGSMWIMDVIITDDDDEKAAFTLWIFDALPTAFADDAAFAPVIGDLDKCVGKIAINTGDYTTVNGNAWAKSTPTEGAITMHAEETNKFYAYLVCVGTPTYTATTDLKLRFGVATQERF
jgi:hypothetical protein